ncbi:MAG: hypothetical protein K940chlam1_00168 [Candidatus Anoxychlamydiales bacterium]|nr:hypothetical protein [Candidatus Anoxychlamydiales bacterium]NGX36146.1 hypothetical protein [Candidatus Anoxychlamydiales bacterium]
MKRKLEKELIEWKNRDEYLPLLLRGARQVGKSYLVEYFGKNYFENIIKIDFEKSPELSRCFKTRDPVEITKEIEVTLEQKIIPGKTLLFLDEIQECPNALISLRYFRELMGDLHVIAAGSLMEFLLNNEKYSFPVGRVEFLYLRPFSFEEFLEELAPIAYQRLQSITLKKPLSEVEHIELLKWVKKYFFIGGMPDAIKKYKSSNSFLECQKVHRRILHAYESDFGQYSEHVQHKFLQMIFLKTPALIGQILKYTNIDKETRSRDLKPAIHLLSSAGLIQQVFATTASGIPLHAHVREHRFKLLFLDIGLLQTALQVDAGDFFEKDIMQINAGMLAEQFVGQEILANDLPDQNRSLLFWEREKNGHAEIDFIKTIDSQIIPIEVKAGATGTLRSLKSFLKLKRSPFGIRISENDLSFYDQILSIPLYLTSKMNYLTLQVLKKNY